MVTNDYQYALSLYREDWTALGQVPAEVDWEPAAECARFEAIRAGKIRPGGSTVAVTVEPVWHASSGSPCVEGLRLSLDETDGGHAESVLTTAYFTAMARAASARFVERGDLKPGELFHYIVSAQPRSDCGDAETGAAFTVESVTPALPVSASSLEAFMQRAVSFVQANGSHMPVFVPRSVLEETAELSRQAGSMETGGALLGLLHRDESGPELFLEVTAQVPATHTRSEATRLTYTPDTWAGFDDAIALRGREELMVGWWHSHSFLKQQECSQCPKRAGGACNVVPSFMSAEDCHLHRVCFPRAFSVALVVGDSPCSGLSWTLFGWHAGVISARGFHILSAPGREAGKEAIPLVGGTPDATD